MAFIFTKEVERYEENLKYLAVNIGCHWCSLDLCPRVFFLPDIGAIANPLFLFLSQCCLSFLGLK